MGNDIVLVDENTLHRTIKRIAHEIVEKNGGIDGVGLVGIRTRGINFANRLADLIEVIEGKRPPVGTLDITLYRDDLSTIGQTPKVEGSDIAFDIAGMDIVLCDDVLFTGRTARAAIEALLAFGRPKTVQLAVLIDRGHRELPIRADYVGKNIPTSLSESVAVYFEELDGESCVRLKKQKR